MTTKKATEPCLTEASPPASNLPAIPTDRVRFYVAVFKAGKAIGIEIDQGVSDHELLERIAEAVTPALAAAFRAGYARSLAHENGHTYGTTTNPHDGTSLLE